MYFNEPVKIKNVKAYGQKLALKELCKETLFYKKAQI